MWICEKLPLLILKWGQSCTFASLETFPLTFSSQPCQENKSSTMITLYSVCISFCPSIFWTHPLIFRYFSFECLWSIDIVMLINASCFKNQTEITDWLLCQRDHFSVIYKINSSVIQYTINFFKFYHCFLKKDLC